MYRFGFLLVIFLVGFSFSGSCQAIDSIVAKPVLDSTQMKSVLFSGKDYSYSVTEPDGWKSDQKNARDFDAEVVLFMNNDSVNKGAALVQLLSFRKADDSTAEDLKSDIEQYKNNFPDLKEEDFTVEHLQYKCYARCLYVEGEFFQYLVYVNPGPEYKRGVSIALNTSKRRPTDEEMRGFREMVASVVVLK